MRGTDILAATRPLLFCGLFFHAFVVANAHADWVLGSSDPIGASSWKSPGNWRDSQTSSPATSSPLAGDIYSTGPFEIRTPQSSAAGTFGGKELRISAGGGLRFKGPSGDTATIPDLVMEGGRLVNGNGNSTFSLEGKIRILASSSFEGGGADRVLSISSDLSGSGLLTIAGGGTIFLGGDNAAFSGGILVGNAALVALSSSALGTGSLEIAANGVFQPALNLDCPASELTIHGRFHLDRDHRFFRVTVGTQVLPPGTYRFQELNARFPGVFPATWSAVAGLPNATVGSGSLTVTGSGVGAAHTLESDLLRLRLFEDPFSFTVEEKSTGAVLLQQSSTRFTVGGISRQVEKAVLVNGSASSAVFDLHLSGLADTCRAGFEFAESGVLRVTLSGQGLATQIAQEFYDLGEEIFGGFECPPSETQASLSSRNTSQKLAQNLGLPQIVSTASAKAPFYFSDRRYGIYADTDAFGILTMAKDGRSGFTFDVPELVFHVLHGNYAEILQSYNSIAGGAFVPPLWALDSIWWKDDDNDPRYMPPGAVNAQGSVLDTASKLAENRIHAGAILIDRPYGTSNPSFAGDGGWGNFDFHPTGFPDPAGMVNSLRGRGLELMLWITDHCWSGLHAEGAANGWLFDPTKTNAYTTADFSNPAAYDWFQRKLDVFVDLGVKGYKIDRLDERASPDSVNNRNNTLFQKLTWEGLEKGHPGEAFTFSRCASDKARRYTAIWNGDTYATFTALRFSILCGLRSGMINFPVWGSDTGGYRSAPTEELFARWLQFSAYSTMMQVLIGSGSQALNPRCPWYDYSPNLVAIAREQAADHHDLMPYSRSHLHHATLNGMPVMRPILFEFPNDPMSAATNSNGTYLFGDALLVAPVIEAGATTRDLYLPDAKWLEYHDRALIHTGPGNLTVAAPLERIPLFVREGAIIPRGDIHRGNNLWTPDWQPSLRIEIFPSDTAPSFFPYFNGSAVVGISAAPSNGTLSVDFADLGTPGSLEILCVNPGRVTKNGRELIPAVDYEYRPSEDLLRIPFEGATSLRIENFRSRFESSVAPHEAWREANFGNSGNPLASAPEADPDHDGLSNLVEYAIGSDPQKSTDQRSLDVVSGDDGRPEFRFWIDSARSDIVCTLQSSSDLNHWSDRATSVRGGPMESADGNFVLSDPGSGRRQVAFQEGSSVTPNFYRLKIAFDHLPR